MPTAERTARVAALAAALLLAPLAGARGQNETPGIDKKNHTGYLYAPYKWAFKKFDIDAKAKEAVAAGESSGQQYEWVELVETKKPTADAPAKTCTVDAFKDLISKNSEKLGVLIISSHGGENSLSVEPFASEKARDAQYDAYVKAGYGKDEISKTENEDAFAISVTDKFIQKYRNVGQALVFISACKGATLADDFTDAKGLGQPASQLARVASGGTTDAKWVAYSDYAARFLAALDGRTYPKKDEADRIPQRAVKAAVDAGNAISGKSPLEAFRVEFNLTGNGATTLSPVVQDGCMGPLKKGDTVTFTFDTNCDTTVVPKVEAAGVTLGAPAWKKDSGSVLEVPVTGPDAATGTFKITLKGDSVKAGKNTSRLDGNSNPDGKNGHGPATGEKSDDYVVEFKAGKRVH